MKPFLHILTAEPISRAYFINPYNQSVLSAARQRQGKRLPSAKNARKRNCVRLVSVDLSVCGLLLRGNNGVVLYVFRVCEMKLEIRISHGFCFTSQV
jgi:hypothetical protein